MSRVIRELLPPDTGRAFHAMKALRTDLADEASFARRVDELQRPEDYRLVGVFEDEGTDAVAVVGFGARTTSRGAITSTWTTRATRP